MSTFPPAAYGTMSVIGLVGNCWPFPGLTANRTAHDRAKGCKRIMEASRWSEGSKSLFQNDLSLLRPWSGLCYLLFRRSASRGRPLQGFTGIYRDLPLSASRTVEMNTIRLGAGAGYSGDQMELAEKGE